MASFQPILDFSDTPLGSIASDAAVPEEDRVGLVTIEVENIGVGPARNVRVMMWVCPKDGTEVSGDAAQFFRDKGFDVEHPHYVAGRNTLATSRLGEVVVLRTDDLPSESMLGPGGINVVALMTYEDIFDRTTETLEVRGVAWSPHEPAAVPPSVGDESTELSPDAVP